MTALSIKMKSPKNALYSCIILCTPHHTIHAHTHIDSVDTHSITVKPSVGQCRKQRPKERGKSCIIFAHCISNEQDIGFLIIAHSTQQLYPFGFSMSSHSSFSWSHAFVCTRTHCIDFRLLLIFRAIKKHFPKTTAQTFNNAFIRRHSSGSVTKHVHTLKHFHADELYSIGWCW